MLGSQFNSFIHPAAIMASLPLPQLIVFLALFLFRSTLNLFSISRVINADGAGNQKRDFAYRLY